MTQTDTSSIKDSHDQAAVWSVEDRRRARTMRRLLALAGKHGLPMPSGFDFTQFEHLGRTYRSLQLDLDGDTDLTGWADALGADVRKDLDVSGNQVAWTLRTAEKHLPHGPRVDWHIVRFSVRCDTRPLSTVTAVTP